MLSNIERTEIESKSQPHWNASSSICVVIKYRKNWNWKQITTNPSATYPTPLLLSNIERTEIESKSQRLFRYYNPLLEDIVNEKYNPTDKDFFIYETIYEKLTECYNNVGLIMLQELRFAYFKETGNYIELPIEKDRYW